MSSQINVYKIEKDIPVPESKGGGVGKVPLDTLEVGESILFPATERNRVQSLATRTKKRTGREFVVRVADDVSCRVWRTK